MDYDLEKNAPRNSSYTQKYHTWTNLLKGDEKLFCDVEDYMAMWIADMDFPVAPEILSAIHERVEQKFLGYTYSNCADYRQTLTEWCGRRYEWKDMNPKFVFCAGGIISSMEIILRHIVQPGKKVLVLTPAYGAFAMSILGAGCQIDLLPLQNKDGYYCVDWEGFERHAKDPDVQAFILCSPHNPTGRVWTERELRRMGEICLENNVFVLSDEIHCDIIRADQRHIPFGKLFTNEKRWVVCSAPSKAFNLAGLHFSNIIMNDPDLIAYWSKTEWGYCTNPLSLAAAQAAYAKGDAWLDQVRRYIDQNFVYVKEYLSLHLPKAIFRIPEGTYLAWIDISAYMHQLNGAGIFRFFIENSPVVVECGDGFIGGDAKCFRLNLAASHETVASAIAYICEAINKQ